MSRPSVAVRGSVFPISRMGFGPILNRMRPSVVATLVVVLLLAVGRAAAAQVLDLPPRPEGAPGGTAIAREIRTLDLDAREQRIYSEFARGNIPSWLRTLVPVELTRLLPDGEHRVTVRVAPDYVAVGSDTDYFLVPLTPRTAQRIADLVHASLPTPPIVDAVWAAASVRLGPDSIPPSPAMTTVPVFEAHDRLVRARRDRAGAPPGALVAGHKKDVVLTARLDTLPGRVAIYGWHRPGGRPIQPLYTGHIARYADYSHGIRLVSRVVLVDGVEHDIRDVLRDTALAALLSDDGPIRTPAYVYGDSLAVPQESSGPARLASRPPNASPASGSQDSRNPHRVHRSVVTGSCGCPRTERFVQKLEAGSPSTHVLCVSTLRERSSM